MSTARGPARHGPADVAVAGVVVQVVVAAEADQRRPVRRHRPKAGAQPGPEGYPSSVRAIGEVFDGRTDIAAELAAGRYVVLHHPSSDAGEDLPSRARRAADLLRDRHGVVVHIGIGESGSGIAALAASCTDAARTRFTRSQLELLATENDFPALRQTVVAWCECGFNLVTTARRLATHRNTVIYRLDKISRLTARDIREPGVAIALYLASLIDA